MIMKNFYLFFLLFITVTAQGQIVNIPDANFKNALLTYSPIIDTNSDGEIQLSEAEAVLGLFVGSNNIHSLEGIKGFTNLTQLSVSENQLTSLDISQNPNIEFLNVEYNQITSLDVSQNPDIGYLNARFNQITSLDVTQNPNLYFLGLPQNQITSLDVTQNPNLVGLSVSENGLTSLDVSQNPILGVLYLSTNQLTSLDVSQNPSLINLTLSRNQLTSLDVSQNPILDILFVSNNDLTSLDVSQNSSLVELILFNNQLSSLNLKNGNNHNMIRMLAQDNPNLPCILVDDENNTYPICAGNNGWCKDSTTIYSEDCVLGIEEYDSINFTIFPNPTQNVLNIESNEAIESIRIYSLQGQLIKVDSSSKVDVTQLSSGLYFVQVIIDGKSETKKFVKK